MNALIRDCTIHARDGFELAATLFEPGKTVERVLIINGATGVPRGYYAAYAQHLSRTGHLALTYDYRGTGQSRPANLKGFAARMRDWAELDMAGVIDWASAFYQPRCLILVGHSIGGQAAGLLDNSEKVGAMLTVSAQSGYWALAPALEKYRLWFYVYLLIPILSHLFGYLPWSRLGRGEDLPRGVALEWARWCRCPDYLCGDKTLASLRNFANFTAPVRAYSFSDDKWGTKIAVNAMMARYIHAPMEHLHRTPQDNGGHKIGHLGFFQPNSMKLWRETDQWILTR